jgi:uncharacterized protein (TIGR04255 family)
MSMTTRPPDLPDFEAPPVAEVVFAVRFKVAEPLRTFHIGLYRELVKAEFPEFQEHAPLPPEGNLGLHLKAGPPPLPRCWFVDESGNRLIQVQPDRFIHNWRKITGEEEYPRYEAIRGEFEKRWNGFGRFLEKENLGAPTVTECELAYVNQIPKGTCWSEPRGLVDVFSFLADEPTTAFLPSPVSLACSLRYELPGDRGSLHANLGPAVRAQDQAEIMRFDLTVRAPMGSAETEEVLQWFDVAREWIVRGFADLTSKKAHKYWRRRL